MAAAALTSPRFGEQQQDPPDRNSDRATDRRTDRRPATQDQRRRRQAAAQDDGAIPANIQFVPDVVYATTTTDDGEPFDLLMDVAFRKESGDESMPVIVYIHGGGYRAGSREQGRGFAIAAAQGGYLGATISYRLAGQAKYPAAVHDCKAAIRFIRASAEELGIDPKRIGVWGHSAGGHLSALIATSGNNAALDGEVGETDVSSAVACAIAVSGPTDFIRMAETPQKETVENWFGKAVDGNETLFESASPMKYLDAKDPPLFIVHGTNDAVVPFEQAELFRDAAKDTGIHVEFRSVEGAGHAINDEESTQRIVAFFDEHLGGDLVGSTANFRRGARRPDRPDRIRD